jgi:serine/threonine-protein kinase RsbW
MRTVLAAPTPRQGRAAVAAALAGQTPEIAHTAELLTSELITNAMEHAGGAQRLVISTDIRGLLVEVFDDSPIFPAEWEAHPSDPKGRGVFLVAALAATWDARRTGSGKVVSFRLDL